MKEKLKNNTKLFSISFENSEELEIKSKEYTINLIKDKNDTFIIISISKNEPKVIKYKNQLFYSDFLSINKEFFNEFKNNIPLLFKFLKRLLISNSFIVNLINEKDSLSLSFYVLRETKKLLIEITLYNENNKNIPKSHDNNFNNNNNIINNNENNLGLEPAPTFDLSVINNNSFYYHSFKKTKNFKFFELYIYKKEYIEKNYKEIIFKIIEKENSKRDLEYYAYLDLFDFLNLSKSYYGLFKYSIDDIYEDLLIILSNRNFIINKINNTKLRVFLFIFNCFNVNKISIYAKGNEKERNEEIINQKIEIYFDKISNYIQENGENLEEPLIKNIINNNPCKNKEQLERNNNISKINNTQKKDSFNKEIQSESKNKESNIQNNNINLNSKKNNVIKKDINKNIENKIKLKPGMKTLDSYFIKNSNNSSELKTELKNNKSENSLKNNIDKDKVPVIRDTNNNVNNIIFKEYNIKIKNYNEIFNISENSKDKLDINENNNKIIQDKKSDNKSDDMQKNIEDNEINIIRNCYNIKDSNNIIQRENVNINNINSLKNEESENKIEQIKIKNELNDSNENINYLNNTNENQIEVNNKSFLNNKRNQENFSLSSFNENLLYYSIFFSQEEILKRRKLILQNESFLNENQLKLIIDKITKNFSEFRYINRKLFFKLVYEINNNSTEELNPQLIIKEFYSKSKGIKNLILLIKTLNNKLFGGFTHNGFNLNNNKGKIIYDNNSFIFSINEMKTYELGEKNSFIICNNDSLPEFKSQIYFEKNCIKYGFFYKKDEEDLKNEEYVFNDNETKFFISEIQVICINLL